MAKRKKAVELTDKEAIRKLFPKRVVDAVDRAIKESDEAEERREKRQATKASK